MSTGRTLPVTRSTGIEDGLAARLADPLWLLARQWQFGEFRGDDAGSATWVSIDAVAHHPTWWRPEPDSDSPATAAWLPWTAASGPLESLIEAEPDIGEAWTRLRIDGGVRARRMLLAAGLPDFAVPLAGLAPWPAPTPQGSAPVDIAAIASNADGAALAALITPWSAPGSAVAAPIAAAIGGTNAQIDAFADTMRAWLNWWNVRAANTSQPTGAAGPEDPAAWDRHRLEHRGTLAFAAAPTVRLHIDRHPGGGVDWFSADAQIADPAELADAPAAVDLAAPQPFQQKGIPLPTTFAGMAAPRFWEFEDATVDWGSVDASPADLARLLLVEFTTVYGNDWFTMPLRLPVGSLVRVDRVQITDSFGGTQELSPFASTSPGWRMYSLQAPNDHQDLAVDYFWCAPTLTNRLVSSEIERVTLRRDEMANTAWSVLEQTSDPMGRTHRVPDDTPAMPAPADPPHYLVQTPVPANWFPLAPQSVGIDSIRLALGGRGPGDDATTSGSVILRGDDWWIYEEELGRAGLTLNRRVQFARWHDGSTRRWVGRAVWPGSGQASSGLQWDVVVE